tara:strand:- start:7272 stop:7457 length:186 start_codon:yes stop_codon:yes gene_type:complete
MKNDTCYVELLEKFDKFDEAISDLKTKINNLMELCDNDSLSTKGQADDTEIDTPREKNDNE